jgi:uncharacterized membrane protein YhaH (DUF805 family)
MQAAFSRRISRSVFLKATFFVWALLGSLGVGFVTVGMHNPLPTLFFLLISVGIQLWYLTLAAGRLRDLGLPGFRALWLLVPLANIYVMGLLLFSKGKQEPNAYGLPPLDSGSEFVAPLITAILLLGLSIGLHYYNPAEHVARSMPTAYTITEIDLQRRLKETPCHAQSAYELSQSYLRSKHYQDVIDLEQKFHAQCPDQVVQLKWSAFAAAKKQDDFPRAEKIVSDLIQAHPQDTDYFAWRGMLYETHGDLAKAATDFESVLRLNPKMQSIPLNLRDAYRQLNQPCKALEVQKRYSALYRNVAQDPGVKELTGKLEAECKTAGKSS